MAKKYYSTKVVGIGGEAEKFSRLAKMVVIFDDSILRVGGEVNNNIKNLGHIVIKFNDDKDDLLEGSIHVEDKPIPKIRIGDTIEIVEENPLALRGKTAAVVGDDKTLCATMTLVLSNNGAQIIEDADKADIVVDVK